MTSGSRTRANSCGFLLTYEEDGCDNPRPHRMLALLPHCSVRRLRDLGADGIKILLSYTPFDDPSANDRKCAWIERIGNECSPDMPFFLEPVGYDPAGLDPMSLEYAHRKPEIVTRSMEEFSKDIYKVDILKVEFPVNSTYLNTAYSRQEVLDILQKADTVARCPYIYLSAGVSNRQFIESLQLATEAKVRYSGVLCGRATWQDGASAFARHGQSAFEDWLADQGVANITQLNESLRSATPWSLWR
ncbi:MAG: tagatose 1,6-diphosphate aldolase [Bryobacteraceae bacterium]